MPLVLLAERVTGGMPWRPGSAVLPWLKITMPMAPAAAAFSAFSSKVHVPRWSNAMFPAGKPTKSVGLTTAGRGVAQTELQVDSSDRGRHVTGIRLIDHVEINALDVGDLFGRRLLEG